MSERRERMERDRLKALGETVPEPVVEEPTPEPEMVEEIVEEPVVEEPVEDPAPEPEIVEEVVEEVVPEPDEIAILEAQIAELKAKKEMEEQQ